MGRTFFLAGSILVSAQLAIAHDGPKGHNHPPAAAKPAAVYAPSVVPDRIILTWTGDPRRNIAVTWRTSTAVKRAFCQVAIAGEGPRFAESAKQIEAATQVLKSNLSEAHYHTVEVKNLRPGVKYAYRVGDGVNWSEWNHFRTASAEHKRFSFVYFGDAQNSIKSHWSRIIRQAYSDAPKAAFMLHAGDLVNRANSDAEWGEWFSAGGWLNRTIPSIATPGNHEYSSRKISRHWRPTFAFPKNGPKGVAALEESVFYIDYPGARIISLNSNADLKPQVSWLRRVLAANKQRWTIVTMHHPIYSSGKGRDNKKLRAALQPVFDEFKVDLVLQGHDHTYGRTNLMATGDEKNKAIGKGYRNPKAGTVYVVSVSGPKQYSNDFHPYFERAAENTQLYQVITIDADDLHFTARTATGKLYDAFTLRKQNGKPNKLINRVPNTSQRRKSSS